MQLERLTACRQSCKWQAQAEETMAWVHSSAVHVNVDVLNYSSDPAFVSTAGGTWESLTTCLDLMLLRLHASQDMNCEQGHLHL